MSPADLQVLILPPSPENGPLRHDIAANRTRRSLLAAGISGLSISMGGAEGGHNFGNGPALIIRAGAWLVRGGLLRVPPESKAAPLLAAVGLPLHSVARQVNPTTASTTWHTLQAIGGGNFNYNHPLAPASTCSNAAPHSRASALRAPTLPLPPVLWLNDAATRVFRGQLKSSHEVTTAWNELQRFARIVRWPAFDVFTDERIRVLQLITSRQRGGAERLAVELTRELQRQGTPNWLVGLGRPMRPVFAAPPGWVDLSGQNESTQRNIVQQWATQCGTDLFHAHLISPDFAVELASDSSGPAWPLVQTIHNTREAWPDGLADRLATESIPHSALFACSQATETELRASGTKAFIRTIWNGIDAPPFAMSASHRRELRLIQRAKLRFGPADLVLLAIANPRPQKRLERLPAIVSACDQRRRIADPTASPTRLLLVGSAGIGSTSAAESVAQITAAAQTNGVETQIHWAGDADDVVPWLAAADVLVNVSAHEGLSLAQLEALAAGLPVVATDVGGARELAARTVNCQLLPVTAGPEMFADTILAVIQRQPGLDSQTKTPIKTLSDSFTLPVMTARHRFLYERLLAVNGDRPRFRSGLWLITNNFSTGGAQSSARRLLIELSRRGHRVTAATLQESCEHPTPGTLAMRAAGITVHSITPPEETDSRAAIGELMRRIEFDSPEVVVAWNALAEYKLHLAESLEGIPLFDVSPGEMYFTSLERSFKHPPAGLPLGDARQYGARLAGVIVKYQAEAVRAAALGAPVHVIRNGVPLFRLARETQSRRDVVTFGTAARLHPHKRLDRLLAAFRAALPQLPGCELLIGGETELGYESHAANLRALAQDLPVRFVGEVADMPSFLGILDVFVMISEPAGCPNASLEAMSAGLPVLATDHGGAAEQVIDRVTGRLLGREDMAALAHAMVEAGGDSALRERWGREGRRRIEEQFSLARMADNYEHLLGLTRPANRS